MDPLARDHGALGDAGDEFVARPAEADLPERDGQIGGNAEIEHAVELGGGRLLEYQLRERSERDFLAVVVRVRTLGNGDAVVDGVRAREARRFKAESGEQRVGFDDALELGRRNGRRRLHGRNGGDAICLQRTPAALRDRHGGVRRAGAAHIQRTAAVARARLEPGRERVAHARDQKSQRRAADHRGVNEHERGIVGVLLRRLDHAVVGVDD